MLKHLCSWQSLFQNCRGADFARKISAAVLDSTGELVMESLLETKRKEVRSRRFNARGFKRKSVPKMSHYLPKVQLDAYT